LIRVLIHLTILFYSLPQRPEKDLKLVENVRILRLFLGRHFTPVVCELNEDVLCK